MKFWELIDDSVLKVCTRFSHWFQRKTGRTNFFIVKIGLFFLVLATMIHVMNYWWPVMRLGTSAFEVFIFTIVLIDLTRNVRQCDINEEKLYVGKVLHHIDLLRMGNSVVWRLICLFFGGMDIITFPVEFQFSILNAIGMSPFISIVTCLYFLKVTPLPPGISSLQKFVEKISGFFKTPVPVPSSTRFFWRT